MIAVLRGDGREAERRDGGGDEGEGEGDGAYMHADDATQQVSYDVVYALFDKQNRA